MALNDSEDLQSDLQGIVTTRELLLSGTIPTMEPILNLLPTIERLSVHSFTIPHEFDRLPELRQLSQLEIGINDGIRSLAFLQNLPELKTLTLYNLLAIDELRNVADREEPIERLWLLDLSREASITNFPHLPRLSELYIDVTENFHEDIVASLVSQVPNLKSIGILSTAPTEDEGRFPKLLHELQNLTELESIWLSLRGVDDISPMHLLKNLADVDLHCPDLHDLSPLSGLARLESVFLGKDMKHVDLRALKNKPVTITVVESSTYRSWRGQLGREVKIQTTGRYIDD